MGKQQGEKQCWGISIGHEEKQGLTRLDMSCTSTASMPSRMSSLVA